MSKPINPSRMRAKMNDKRLTNAELAELSGTSESTIKRALNGANMSHYTLSQIADSLDVREEWLSGDEPEIEPGEPAPGSTADRDDPVEPAEPEEAIRAESGEARQSGVEEAIEAVGKIYIERIEDLRQRVEDQKTLYYKSRRECHALWAFIVAIVSFICIMLAVDVFNPNIGWVRN